MLARKVCRLASMFVFVQVMVCPVGYAAAGGRAAAGNPGNPAPFPSLESIQFSYPKIASQVHLFLFITRDDVAQAHKRMGQEAATIYAAVYQAEREQLPEVQIRQVEAGPDRLAFQVTGPWGQAKHLIPHLP